MKNDIQLFNYKDYALRTVEIEGEFWFIAKDVCDILGYTNVTKTLNDHLDDDERNTLTIRERTSSKGGNPNMNVINESGLYTLIMRSNKKEAKKFRKWVTSEVLPNLRKTGKYSLNDSEYENYSIENVEEIEETKTKYISRGILRTAKMIYETTGLKDFQLTLALDKVFQHYTGESALEIAGIRLKEKWVEDDNEDFKGIFSLHNLRYEWEHDYPPLPLN